jgi:hypothetical protein
MSSCTSCPVGPPILNGACANSEGGRLSRLLRSCCYKGNSINFPGDTSFCKLKQPVGIAITPPQSTRVNAYAIKANRLTQTYVKSLLAAKAIRTINYPTESTRIAAVEATAAACAPPNPLSLRIQPINTNCLPIPPPPGPPASCALTKNQKY